MTKTIFKKTRDRANKTRLYVFETGKWAAGNASVLMELITTGVRTAAGSVSARNAAVDITHAAEDYVCSDYKCLFLDTAAIIAKPAATSTKEPPFKSVILVINSSCLRELFLHSTSIRRQNIFEKVLRKYRRGKLIPSQRIFHQI